MLRLRHYRESDVETFLSIHFPTAVEGGEPEAIIRTIDCLESSFPACVGSIECVRGVVLEDPVNDEGLIGEGRTRVLKVTAASPLVSVSSDGAATESDVMTPSSIVTLPLTPYSSVPESLERERRTCQGQDSNECPEDSLHKGGVAEGHESDVLKTHEGTVPTTDDSGAPTTHESGVPTTHESGVPTTHESEVPTTHESEVPTTHESDVVESHEGAVVGGPQERMPQPPDPPESASQGGGPTSEDEPAWLQFPPELAELGVQTTCTRIRCGSKTEIILEGKIPPKQLVHISRQNASLVTEDNKMARVFRVRNAVRVGSLTVDLASWDEQSSSYQAKVQTRSVTPPARLSFPSEFLRRAPVNRDPNVVPIRLPFAGDGSVARLHRMKMKELSRR